MAEESFIILDNPPSTIEPYSFLEMPSSASFQSTSASMLPSAANASAAPAQPKQKPNVEEITEQMKSIWAKPMAIPGADISVDSIDSAGPSVAAGPQPPIAVPAESAASSSIAIVTDNDDKSNETVFKVPSMLQKNDETQREVVDAETAETEPAIPPSANEDATPYSSVATGFESLSGRRRIDDLSMNSPKSTATPLPGTPKDKLAESFLLGNIDYDTMMSSTISHFPDLIRAPQSIQPIVAVASKPVAAITPEHVAAGPEPAAEALPAATNADDPMKERDQDGRPYPHFSLISDFESNDDLDNVAYYRTEPLMALEVTQCHKELEELTKCNNELHKKIDDLQRIIHVHQTTMNDAVDVEISAQAESIAGDENIENVRKEYEQKIRTMQFELSKAIGENMEFEDMKNTYMDEINCLKVNLVATEELYKESVAQSNILTSRNAYLSQELTDNKKHIGAMNSQIDFLKQQLDQYKKDFENERIGRQELRNERERMLTDMNHLQRRYYQIVQVNDSEAAGGAAGGPASYPPPSLMDEARAIPQFFCPICNKGFGDVQVLVVHAEQCLDSLESNSRP